MRDGRQHGFAGPGAWLAAIRGLRDNPVRCYLLSARRRRKLTCWLRPSLLYSIAAALAVVIPITYFYDVHNGLSAAEAWSEQANPYRFSSVWLLVSLVLIWWCQGLFIWVNDALSLFSYDRTHTTALPVELALIPERNSAVITGAISVLLPPVLWRALGIIIAFYAILPWSVLSRFVMYHGGHVSYSANGLLPPLSKYLNLCYNGGIINLSLAGAICALALTCMLIVASQCGLSQGIRTACAFGLPVVQIGSTVYMNLLIWNTEIILQYGYRYVLIECVKYLPLASLMVASIVWIPALFNKRAKPALAIVVVLLPVLSGLIAAAIMAQVIHSRASNMPVALPAAWAGGFFVLVNPLSAPDPSFAVPDSKWGWPDQTEAWDYGLRQSIWAPETKISTSYMINMRNWLLHIWLYASAIHYFMLLIIAAISLEAARLSAAHWRQEG